MDDLLNEFLTETNESIDVVDVELVKLEQDPNNKEVLDNIFRLVHTIKGTCGFLGLPRLERVAHASENVLGKFRDGDLKVTPAAVTVVLESLDRIKDILAGLEAHEEEPAGDDSDLIGRLDDIALGKDPAAAAAPAAVEEAAIVVAPQTEREVKPGEVSLEELERVFAEAPGPDEGAAEAAPAADKGELFDRFGGVDSVAVASHMLVNRITANAGLKEAIGNADAGQQKTKIGALLTSILTDDIDGASMLAASLVVTTNFSDQQFDDLVAVVKSVTDEMKVAEDAAAETCMMFELLRDPMKEAAAKKAPKEEAKKAVKQPAAGASRVTQSIRVNVDLLEDLMNMVSELVLTRNQLLQMARQSDSNELAVPLQRLSQCTTELQEGVMKTRMQPIGNAWAKLPRIVRDLTVDLGKKIDLVMKGQDTELDRQILELIKDPLTHMVRNSADHGVEMPAERLAKGKPETGKIRLNAYHEGGHIIIEISDDGAGIKVAKLKPKILEKGLATQAELDEMTDSQIQRFIFHAGFSTAEKVTSVSGRGVGMDVVRSNIEKIGGQVDLVSVEDKGSTFYIKIPLTLAIVSALIVEVAEDRYAVPQISVLELVRTSGDSEYQIEQINETPVLRLRNRLLPLVFLRDVLGYGSDESEDPNHFIIVSQVGTFTFGIVVDRVFDTEEIVVKPVAPILKGLSAYSGNTILGDGTVIMILDPNGVAAMAGDAATQGQDVQDEEESSQTAASTDTESLLLFRAGSDSPKAVSLSLIARLEELEVSSIEVSDGRRMVQYRGSLMPLELVDDNMKLREEGRQPVLVFSDEDKNMGLAVDAILDIVEQELDIDLDSESKGVIGSAVIDGKATELIDVSYYANLAYDDWLNSRDQQVRFAPEVGTRLLVIDDSSFFRNMLKPLLQVAGYKVRTVDGSQAALDLMEGGVDFDIIISDIEMPGMDGFDLAKTIRAGTRWADLPLIALSSHATDRDFARGREVGFSDYVAKFDKDALLHSLSQQLTRKGDAA